MNFNLNMFQNNMMIGMNEPQMNIIPIHNLNEFDNNNNHIYNKMFVIFQDNILIQYITAKKVSQVLVL